MATTTASAIRDEIERRIGALVPAIEAVRFLPFEQQEDFREWAVKSAPGCLRRFSVRASGAVSPPVVSDGVRVRVSQDFEVIVAYPKGTRFRSLVGLDAVIDSDLWQIEHEVGTEGFATYAAAVPAATVVSPDPTRREDDDTGVVFGILSLVAHYWRAQP